MPRKLNYNPIICAVDTTDTWQAAQLVREVHHAVGMFKFGLEYYTAQGRKGLQDAIGAQPVFLDLKLHDIPNTVGKAIRATSGMAARMITVHTMGGPDMMKAAMDASRELAERTQQERPLVLGVTILTSLQDSDMHHIGVRRKTASQVKHLAELAQKSGLDGIVCSPRELSLIRPECDKKFLLVTPGIRPKDADAGDQRRTLTPKEAIEQGADYIVIGRPITEAQDPRAAAEAILKEVQQARRKV